MTSDGLPHQVLRAQLMAAIDGAIGTVLNAWVPGERPGVWRHSGGQQQQRCLEHAAAAARAADGLCAELDRAAACAREGACAAAGAPVAREEGCDFTGTPSEGARDLAHELRDAIKAVLDAASALPAKPLAPAAARGDAKPLAPATAHRNAEAHVLLPAQQVAAEQRNEAPTMEREAGPATVNVNDSQREAGPTTAASRAAAVSKGEDGSNGVAPLLPPPPPVSKGEDGSNGVAPRYRTRGSGGGGGSSGVGANDDRLGTGEGRAGLRAGCCRRLPPAGAWLGGRLLLVAPSLLASAAHQPEATSASATSATEAFAALEDAEDLFRRELPSLSVHYVRHACMPDTTPRTAGGGGGHRAGGGGPRTIDFVREQLMHASGSLTAVLIRGSGSVYDDHGEAALLGALTLRRHAAGATRGHVNGDGGARDGSVGDGGDGGGGDGGDVGNGGDGIVESGVEVEETRERGKWEKREHEIRASPSKGHAAILTTAVEPAWQRRGLGTLLVRWVQQLATAEGLRCVLVAASPDAQAFWVRVGFVTPPPIEIPREWVQALESEFEHAHILCWLPQSPEDELQPAVRVAAAIESLISACNAASAKRQRIL